MWRQHPRASEGQHAFEFEQERRRRRPHRARMAAAAATAAYSALAATHAGFVARAAARVWSGRGTFFLRGSSDRLVGVQGEARRHRSLELGSRWAPPEPRARQ